MWHGTLRYESHHRTYPRPDVPMGGGNGPHTRRGALVASSKTRQRKLARAKLHRQLARQAEQQRRGRRVRAGLAIFLTVALVGLGSAWLLGAFDKEPKVTPETQCLWTKQDPASNPDVKD